MGICILNKLIVFPTKETLDSLKTVFTSAPFLVHWDRICLILASSRDPIKVNPKGYYKALTGSMNIWYETLSGKSNLLLPIIPSPEMVDRHNEVGDAWSRNFVPYVNVLEDPIIRRERKAFINSVASSLVDMPMVLAFHNEIVVESTSIVPDQMDFYEDVVNRGQVPVQIYSDPDMLD